MEIVLVVFLCLFLSFAASAQTESEIEKADYPIEEISLARGDGDGKPGAAAEKFNVTDRPIYCVIQLNSEKSVAVKMIFVAAKAERLKPETKIVTINYTTKENENGVTFNASPNGVWAAGEYRVDIYINNKLAKSKAFQIGKVTSEKSKEKSPAPKAFVSRKKVNKSKNN